MIIPAIGFSSEVLQMNYRDAMKLLSQCGIGMVVTGTDHTILEANRAADSLLVKNGTAVGKNLKNIAPSLCESVDKHLYSNPVFGFYLRRIEAPELSGLPDGASVYCFRDATAEAYNEMLTFSVNHISEALVLSDSESRLWLLNDAAVRMDSLVNEDIHGATVEETYRMRGDEDLKIPRVLREKKPMLNHRQHYTTRFGKDVDSMSSTFPIIKNGQTLGAVNILEDWSNVEELQNQVLMLQGKLADVNVEDRRKKKKSTLGAEYTFEDVIHVSPAMKKIIDECKNASKSDSSVMIYGETGTGKELIAQSIHNASARADGPFLAINCAAIPESLLESMLFGTVKGAYTGAENKEGLFEFADGGTLLLDEINSMQVTLQAKLLRVLQDGMVRRVGGTTETHVDVRVLSNINIPPYEAIAQNKLRQDLFYRLGVVTINLPPLRERREDILLLSKHFMMRCNEKLHKMLTDLDKDTLSLFQSYAWPGNVRELQHAIEHAMNVLPAEECCIRTDALPAHMLNHSGSNIFMQSVSAPPAGPARLIGRRRQRDRLPDDLQRVKRDRRQHFRSRPSPEDQQTESAIPY